MTGFPTPAGSRPFIHPRSLVVLFVCIAILLMIADRAPIHLDRRNPDPPISSDFTRHFDGVINGTIGGPYAYRVLVPWTTFAIHRVVPSVSNIDIDAALKTLVLFILQAAFFWSLRRYFQPWIALAGVLLLDVLIGYSLSYVLGPASGETTDLLNLLVFVLGLEFMLEPRTPALLILFVVGMLNRETPLLLVPLVFAVDRSERRGITRSCILLFASVAVYVGLRMALRVEGGSWFTMEGVAANIPGMATGMEGRALMSLLHVAVLLGPLFFMSAMGFMQKPLIFRGSIILAGVMVVIHFAVGTVIESRLWMPVFALLIPPSLETLRWHFGKITSP